MSFEIKINFELSQEGRQLENVYVKTEKSEAFQSKNALFIPLENIPTPAKFICVSSNSLSSEMIQFCERQAKSGVNVYILLGNLDKSKSDATRVAGACLVRTGVSQHGSIILLDGNLTQPQLYYSPIDDFESLSFIQSDESAIPIYETFCYGFWEKATHEYRKQMGETQTKKKSLEGNIHLSSLYSIQSTSIKEDLNSPDLTLFLQSDCLDSLNSLIQERNDIKKIHFNLKSESKSVDIESFSKRAETSFLMEAQKLKFNLISNSQNCFILPHSYNETENINWILFDKKTYQTVSQNLNKEYEFKKKIEIRNLERNSDIRFADEVTKKYSVHDAELQNQTIYAKTIDEYLEIKTKNSEEQRDFLMLHHKEKFTLNRDLISHSIPYRISLYPPQLPSNSKNDPLTDEWKKNQDDWVRKLEGLEKKIETNNKNVSGWNKPIAEKLSKFILGSNQGMNQYKDEIKELKQIELGKLPPGLRDQKIKQFQNLNSNVSKHIDDTDAQKKRAESEMAREKEVEALKEKIESMSLKISQEKDSEKIEQLKKQRTGFEEDLEKKKQSNSKISSSDKEFQSQLGITDSAQPVKLLDFPSEYLPISNSELYVKDNSRYLLIKSLEKIDDVKKDAERLKAQICLKGE
jgi:hypothetical protein